MNAWDFSCIVMASIFIGVSLYGYFKTESWGCLVVAGCWGLALIATLLTLDNPAPFCG